ncbi:MAG: hypothetical protein RSF77_05835 [Oscillospiraceae bacterium]
MLTLKEPIKLNINPRLTVSEEFYERIVGNYGLMSMHITPKELLFFLSTPPEIPEDLGGMTSIAIQNTTTDNRAITMDVVNNVVNRVLLSDKQSFSYQDSIYIENVLNKLGVTDVSLFMKQVKNLREEHLGVKELISLYHEELKLREAATGHSEEGKKSASETPAAQGEGKNALSPYYIQNEIYKRLDTAEIYEIVNSFQQEQSHFYGSYRNNEIKTSEQLATSRFISLSQLRERTVSGAAMELLHSVNHFELGDILPPPQTEEQVLSQAATASLLSTVEHVLVQNLFDRSSNPSTWLSLENALFETVSNSVSRFQSFHSESSFYGEAPPSEEHLTLVSLKNEAEILKEIISSRTQLETISRQSFLTEEGELSLPSLTLLASSEEENEEGEQESVLPTDQSVHNTNLNINEILDSQITKADSTVISETIINEATSPTEAGEKFQKLELDHAEAPQMGEEAPLLEEAEEKKLSEAAVREISAQSLKTLSELTQPPITQSTTIRESEAGTILHKTLRETELQYDVQTWNEMLREVVSKENVAKALAQEAQTKAPDSPSAVTAAFTKLREQFVLPEESKPGQSFYSDNSLHITKLGAQLPEAEIPIPQTQIPINEEPASAEMTLALSDREAEPELLAREVQEIERRNRERFESIQGARAMHIAENIPVPDQKKIMSDALRALESPETVIKELLAQPENLEHPMGMKNAQLEAYLSGADEQTKSIFEAVLRYEQNPNDGELAKAVRPGSIGEFNVVTAEHPHGAADTLRETQRLQRETTLLSENTETLLEQFSEAPQRHKSLPREPVAPPKVPIIHKQEQTDFSTELLERLEQQQTKSKIITDNTDEITHRHTNEIIQNEVSTQVVTQSAEDIQRLVNQTLSKQMNAISEKVYHQMEKKLQAERSRRGRF